MPNNIKKMRLRKKIDSVIYDIYTKTSSDIVEYGNTTVKDQLDTLVAGLAAVITEATVDSKISTAVDTLYNRIMGITAQDGTAVSEAYDTLKEVANYLTAHGNVVQGFTTDIGNLKTTVGTASSGLVKDVDDLQTTVAAMDYSKVTTSNTNGKLNIDGVEVTVYDEPASFAASRITEDSTHKFVTEAQVSIINAAASVKVVSAMPADASVSENDLYFLTIPEPAQQGGS